MPIVNTDRIEKQVVLRAPRSRVWKAITDSKEFGRWFGARVDGAFTAGATLKVVIAPTTVDPEVAAMQKPFEGTPFEIVVGRIEPERLFQFRWHPFSVEPGVDYSREPMTLVEFALEEVPEGTRLTVSESGFDRLPLARRAKAFAANEGGWSKQVELVQKYLASSAHGA